MMIRKEINTVNNQYGDVTNGSARSVNRTDITYLDVDRELRLSTEQYFLSQFIVRYFPLLRIVLLSKCLFCFHLRSVKPTKVQHRQNT